MLASRSMQCIAALACEQLALALAILRPTHGVLRCSSRAKACVTAWIALMSSWTNPHSAEHGIMAVWCGACDVINIDL